MLAFIRDYLGRTGLSPSYGEIAAGLDSNRNRVRNRRRRGEGAEPADQ